MAQRHLLLADPIGEEAAGKAATDWTGFGRFAVMAWRAALIGAVTLAGGVRAQGLPQIGQAWTDLLPEATASRTPVAAAANRAFLNHFFFESRTDYCRYSTSFTALPTASGVTHAPVTGVFNPNGIPYPDAFH